MNETTTIEVRAGDVIELTLRDERVTAEVMLVSEGQLLLDLFDGDRLAFADLDALVDVAVFRPDAGDLATAA